MPDKGSSFYIAVTILASPDDLIALAYPYRSQALKWLKSLKG
jgi:hypothetical protein